MNRFVEKRYALPDIWFGVLFGALALVPFMRVRINYSFFELSGASQFVVFVVGFVALSLAAKLNISSLATVLRDRVTILFGMWCAYAIASALWAEEPTLVLKRVVLAIFPAILVFLAAALVKQPEKVIRGFILGLACITAICVVYAAVGLLADLLITYPGGRRRGTIYFFGWEFAQSFGQRLFWINGELVKLQRFSGFFPNPNGLGITSGICILLLSAIRRDVPTLFRILFGMMIVGVILSGSRTALIILLTGCLYLFLSRKINYRFVVAVVVLGALAFPVMIVLLKGGVLQLSFLPNWVLEQEALIATIRGPYLVDASHAALTHWLFGAGFGIGAEVAFGQKANEMAVHSVFLNAIIETGVLGLILLSAVWIMSIVVAGDNDHRRSPRDSVMGYLSAVLLSLFVAQSVDLSVTRFHYVHLMFFFILGLVASFKRTELEMRV